MADQVRHSPDGSRERLEALELQAVLEALVDPVLVLDEDTRIVEANAAAVTMFGFDPHGMDRAEFIRRTAPRDTDGAPVAPGELPTARARRGERAPRQVLRVTLAGTEHWIVATAAAFSRKGERQGTVLAFHDVTEREELVADMRESVRLTGALNRINAEIDSSLDMESIMRAVVRESAEALGAQRAVIAMREAGGWVGRYLYGAAPGVRWVPIPEAEHGYIERVAESAEPLVVSDALSDPRISRDLAQRENVGAVVSFRLETHGDLVGVMRFTYDHPIVLGAAQRDFVEKLAAVVSLGLENARLLAAERAVSEKLQSALLTVPKRTRGIHCGTLYHSASETARVGGDFYDLFEVPSGLVAIVIGDVSGKGLEAAAMTSLVKNTLRAYAEEEHPPHAVLSMTNRIVLLESAPEMFVTLFFGLLDTRDGTLAYANGGHPAPLVKSPAGVVSLEVRSPFVGAFRESEFVEGHAVLTPDDVLLLYTDGVTEARCEDGRLGEDRLVAFVASLPSTPASLVPDAVYRFVTTCTGGGLSDDLALLAVSMDPRDSR